jgi:hypothetical protein
MDVGHSKLRSSIDKKRIEGFRNVESPTAWIDASVTDRK